MYHIPSISFFQWLHDIDIPGYKWSQMDGTRHWFVVVLLTSHDIDVPDIILCFKTIIHNHCRPVVFPHS